MIGIIGFSSLRKKVNVFMYACFFENFFYPFWQQDRMNKSFKILVIMDVCKYFQRKTGSVTNLTNTLSLWYSRSVDIDRLARGAPKAIQTREKVFLHFGQNSPLPDSLIWLFQFCRIANLFSGNNDSTFRTLDKQLRDWRCILVSWTQVKLVFSSKKYYFFWSTNLI